MLIQSGPVYFSFWPSEKKKTHRYSAALTPAQRSISLESPESSRTLTGVTRGQRRFLLPEPPACRCHQGRRGRTGRDGRRCGSAAVRPAGVGTGSAKHKTFINERPGNRGRIDPAINHLEGETCAQKGNPRLPKVRYNLL